MLMQILRVCLCVVLSIAAFFPGTGKAFQSKEDPEIQKTLNKVDEAAGNFRSFTAKFVQKRYLALLKEYETPESGEFYYALARDKSVRMRHEIAAPVQRITTISGASAVVYEPKTKEATEYLLGKRKNLVEYLATGMGQSASKLREQFYITYQGTEAIQGTPCSVLVFVPRNQSAAASVKSITIWFKKLSGIPAQYKFLEPTGDFMLETFSEERLNAKIPDSKFEQKFSRDVEVQKF
jgi:outer membrane lipoprotein-sorting protein